MSDHIDKIENDLFRLTDYFFKGKWILILSIVFSVLSSFAYLEFKKEIFIVKAPFVINFYSPNSIEYCNSNIICMEEMTLSILQTQLEFNEWEQHGSYFSKEFDSDELVTYESDLNSAQKKSTDYYYNNIVSEKKSLDSIEKTEYYDKTIEKISQQGINAIHFFEPIIVKKKNRKKIVLLTSFSFGFILGIILMYLYFFYNNYLIYVNNK